jgi:hypothetical protein
MSLQIYCEDATDRGGVRNYDAAALNRLEWFTFDVGLDAADNCRATFAMLNGPKLALHPDLSAPGLLGPSTNATPRQWGTSLQSNLDRICPGLSAVVRQIILEPENSGYPALIGTGPDSDQYLGYFYQQYDALFDSWKTFFPQLEAISTFATAPWDLTAHQHKNPAGGPQTPVAGGVWLEAYNVWSADADCTACKPTKTTTTTTCADCPASPQCKIDFNSTAKACTPKLDFPGAQCGPDGYTCPPKACGGHGCVTKVHPCGVGESYGGGIYDPTAPTGSTPWTAQQRGQFLGEIVSSNLNTTVGADNAHFPKPGATPAELTASPRWIYFPFSDGSCPSLSGVIQTEAQYAEFLAGFKAALLKTATAGTFTQPQLDEMLYGAWGVPPWLLQKCAADADCTSDALPRCDALSRACVGCTESKSCTDDKHGTKTTCNKLTGACVAPPAKCAADADCTSDTLPRCDALSRACVGCTESKSCTDDKHGTKTTCNKLTGACVAPPAKCAADADCTSDALAKCDHLTGACVECTDSGSCSASEHGSHTTCRRGACVEPGGLSTTDRIIIGCVVGGVLALALGLGLGLGLKKHAKTPAGR